MTSQRDPVCGMTVDPAQAAGQSTYGGETFYFCSTDCLKAFEENPGRYATKEGEGGFETHEPPHRTIAGVPLPKFGSAGGGGLEREPGPEAHAKDSTSRKS